jgi:hypothetical protein
MGLLSDFTDAFFAMVFPFLVGNYNRFFSIVMPILLNSKSNEIEINCLLTI